MRKRTTTCRYAEWKQMPTEALDKLLQEELRKEHPSEDVVLPILKIIEKREKNTPVELSPKEAAAWERYKTRISTSTKPTRKKKWVLSAVAAAAAVCIVVMAIPRTVGAQSVFQTLFRWTESVFEFLYPDAEERMQREQGFITDNSGLQQVYDKLTELGVTEQVVPMWLPDESELQELKVTPTPYGNKVRATLNTSSSLITLSYRIFVDTPSMQYQKENTFLEMYETQGIEHCIMENNGNLFVLWTVSNVECTITTDVEIETVYKIIQSIYRRNPT